MKKWCQKCGGKLQKWGKNKNGFARLHQSLKLLKRRILTAHCLRSLQ